MVRESNINGNIINKSSTISLVVKNVNNIQIQFNIRTLKYVNGDGSIGNANNTFQAAYYHERGKCTRYEYPQKSLHRMENLLLIDCTRVQTSYKCLLPSTAKSITNGKIRKLLPKMNQACYIDLP